jgi:hypothetical protein
MSRFFSARSGAGFRIARIVGRTGGADDVGRAKIGHRHDERHFRDIAALLNKCAMSAEIRFDERWRTVTE